MGTGGAERDPYLNDVAWNIIPHSTEYYNEAMDIRYGE